MFVNFVALMSGQEVYISLGTNMGNRKANLKQALQLCEEFVGPVCLKSGIYETAAWGITNQKAFLNQVVMIKTQLNPKAILSQLLNIEKSLGRIRDVKWGPRIIDLDILFIDKKIINISGLQVPHPQIPFRKFVLLPLVEIANQWVHPVLNATMTQLLQDCKDQLEAKLIV